MSPGYLANIESLTHPQALRPHVKIAFSRWEKPVQWTLRSGNDAVQLDLDPPLVINDYTGVHQGVLDGLGISEIPSFICEAALHDRRLVEVLPEWRFATIKVAATYPSNRYLSPLVRCFKEFCVEYFERKPLA